MGGNRSGAEFTEPFKIRGSFFAQMNPLHLNSSRAAGFGAHEPCAHGMPCLALKQDAQRLYEWRVLRLNAIRLGVGRKFHRANFYRGLPPLGEWTDPFRHLG
jgi:hypothetical protein